MCLVLERRKKYFSKIIYFSLGISIICGFIGIFYSLNGSVVNAGVYDLLQTKNLDLLIKPIKLFWPNGSFFLSFINCFSIAGFTVGLFCKDAKPVAKIFSYQILCGVLIGILVVLKRYYFVERLFIFNITCQATLATYGVYWASSKLFKNNKIVAGTFAVAALLEVIFLMASNKNLNRSHYLNDSAEVYKLLHTDRCFPWEGTIHLYIGKNEDVEFSPNFIAMLNKELKDVLGKKVKKIYMCKVLVTLVLINGFVFMRILRKDLKQ